MTQVNKNQFHVSFLSLASLSFALGIVFANYLKIYFFVLFVLSFCVLALLICLKKRLASNIWIISMFFIVGMLHQVNFSTLKTDDIYHLSKHELNEVSLKGTVASQVQQSPFDKSFVFYPQDIEIDDSWIQVSGKVYVRFNKRVDIDYAEHLIIEGRLRPLKDKGYFNKRLIRQGINSVLYVGKRDWITKQGCRGFSLRRLAFGVRDKLKRRFEDVASPAKDFLVAFILGDRSGLPNELYSVFKRTGTVHILAISGLHIGIIILIILVFLKAARIKLKARFIFTILFLLFYSFMTGLRPSVVRAVIMGTTFLFSFIVKREYHIYNSLALAAMIILSIWPWQIFDVGFQLSFISVFSIIFLSPKILCILPKPNNRLIYLMLISLVISLSAWLGVAPLVAYYFGTVSLISAIANVFIVLFMPFILAGGFIYLFMSFVLPIFATWVALSLEFIIDILILLAVGFQNVPFSHLYVERFPIPMLFIYYGLIFVLFSRLPSTSLSKRFPK